MDRYQVTLTVTKIDSRAEENVALPRHAGSPGDFLRALASAADRSNLTFQVRDDTTPQGRFAIKVNPETKQPYERGSAGYYMSGKVLLEEGN